MPKRLSGMASFYRPLGTRCSLSIDRSRRLPLATAAFNTERLLLLRQARPSDSSRQKQADR